MTNTILNRYPELKELFYQFRYCIQHAQRQAEEIILDDQDVMRQLKISKRKLQYLKAKGSIPYHFFEAGGTRTYYLLSDILDILKENRVESVSNTKKIK